MRLRQWHPFAVAAGLGGAFALACEGLPLDQKGDTDNAGSAGRALSRPSAADWGVRGTDLHAEGNGAGTGKLFTGSSAALASGGAGGNAGAAGGEPGFLAFSLFCGDGVRDTAEPIQEECDDELGSEPDLCTAHCQVTDTLAVPLGVPASGPPSRYLGEGRHPVAGANHGFGVVFVDAAGPAPAVKLSVFNSVGDPNVPIDVSQQAEPVLFANPVVAALPNGGYAVAWTDFEGDGDELGIGLRRITPTLPLGHGSFAPVYAGDFGARVTELAFANDRTSSSQYDADILALGNTLVAAWVDNAAPETAPDLRYRTFNVASDPSLPFVPTSSDRVLSDGPEVETNVALTGFGSGFAAAWRSGKDNGLETVEVFASQSNVRWSVSTGAAGHWPGPTEDRPAIVEIGPGQLLLVFTEGTDPLNTNVATVGRLRATILNAGEPDIYGIFQINPQEPGYTDLSLSLSQPSLARIGDRFYLSWHSAARAADPNGEDVWLARIQFLPTLLVLPEVRFPRWPAGSLGDQRFGAIAAVPELLGTDVIPAPAPDGGLALAWTDFGRTVAPGQGQPDVVTSFLPEPIVRFAQWADCSVAAPCAAGRGDCDASAECASGLVCPVNAGNGPNFGFGPDVDACVLAHCANGVWDADEENIDCGGADCGGCLCGDGIWTWTLGEECDTFGANTPSCDYDCTVPDCGDSVWNNQAGEACDSGGVNTPTCDPNCTTRVCGDGYENPTAEQCDDGNGSNTDACVSGCMDATCGDSFIRTGVEQCDDGNTSNTDACVGACQNAVCGDSFVRSVGGSEACDSGGVNTASCDANCTPPQCGDGTLNTAAGETCEPSPAPESATCDRNCTARTCGDNHVNPVAGEVCEASIAVDCLGDCHQPLCGQTISIPQCNGTCIGYTGGCTHGGLCLKVQHRVATGDTSTDNLARPIFRIVNNGFVSVPLSQIKLRYYFTIDGVATMTSSCVSATLPGGGTCSQVTRNFVTLSPTRPTADRYLEVGFTGTGTLAPCASTGNISLTFGKSPLVNLTESNDYSYNGVTSFADRTQITIYRNSSLIWGTVP